MQSPGGAWACVGIHLGTMILRLRDFVGICYCRHRLPSVSSTGVRACVALVGADDSSEVGHLSGAAPAVQVTVWFPAQFAELRRICLSACGGVAAFCASLSRCHRYLPPTLSGLRL